MENQQNRSRRETSAERTKNLAKSADVLSKHFRKWARAFPNQPIGRETVLVYLEALADLSPEQIDAGCANAIKTEEVFPKPGHIRAAVPFDKSIFLGPPMLEYTETLTPEEREEAIKESAKFRAAIQKQFEPKKPDPPTLKKIPPLATPTRSIEEQKAELRQRGFLK